MKTLICIIGILGFIGTVEAERNPIYKNYATPERLERWQGLGENLTYYNLFILMREMYYMPREPWPEAYKQILLKMSRTYRQMLKDEQNRVPILLPDFVTADRCGEIYSYMSDMVNRQKDSRFVFFYDGYDGGGASERGLAGMGEPAFELIIRNLKSTGYAVVPLTAARSLELIMQKEDNYIRRDPIKFQIAQEALIEATRSDNDSTVHGALVTLRYFPSERTLLTLEKIMRTDPSLLVSKRSLGLAKESLQYIRNHN